MPKRLAVIYALPVGGNPGMLSVEAGFESFRRRHALDCEVRTYSFEMSPAEGAWARPSLQAKWEEARAADALIYWGDFQQARRFHLHDLLQREERGRRQDALERSYKHLLLLGAPDALLEKTILFGGSLLSDDVSDACDPAYGGAAGRLFSRAREVWMRDPVSVSLASALAGHARPIRLGVDCALLHDTVKRSRDAGPKTRPVCGWSIARSAQPARSRNFMRAIADRMNAELRPLHWFGKPTALSEKIEAIAACDFVVTDIYHLAVNCWREGVPAVCIGKGAEVRNGSLSDKKKELFYAACGARPFYVFLEWLGGADGLASEADRIAKLLARPALAEAVTARLRRQARAVEADLALALKELLRARLSLRGLAWR